jgi:hypothetical protein
LCDAIPRLNVRAQHRERIERLLVALKLDASHAEHLTGPMINQKYHLRERKSESRAGHQNPLFKFIYYEWRSIGDAGYTTPEFMAEILGLSASSVNVRLNMGKGSFTRSMPHPEQPMVMDIVTVSRSSEQPDSAAQRAQVYAVAEAYLETIRAVRANSPEARRAQTRILMTNARLSQIATERQGNHAFGEAPSKPPRQGSYQTKAPTDNSWPTVASKRATRPAKR